MLGVPDLDLKGSGSLDDVYVMCNIKCPKLYHTGSSLIRVNSSRTIHFAILFYLRTVQRH